MEAGIMNYLKTCIIDLETRVDKIEEEIRALKKSSKIRDKICGFCVTGDLKCELLAGHIGHHVWMNLQKCS